MSTRKIKEQNCKNKNRADKGIRRLPRNDLQTVEKKEIVKMSEIARQLNVVSRFVTNPIESLEKRGLIRHKLYKGVKLTDKGFKNIKGFKEMLLN